MDANSNNDGDAFKRTRRNYSENSSSRDGSSFNNGGQWHETQRDQDHRRGHGRKRDRSREADWNRHKIFHDRGRENFHEENGSSFNNGGQWHEIQRDHLRDHGRKRDSSREVNWNLHKTVHGRDRENFHEENDSSFNNGGQWREIQSDHGRKRDSSREVNWNLHKIVHGRDRENFHEENDSSFNIGGQWHEIQSDHGRKRDSSQEVDWNRDKIIHGRVRENFYEENGSSFNNGGQWHEIQRDHGRKRDSSQEVDWDRHENFQEENREIFNEETPQQDVQQPALFPPYPYNRTDHSCVDDSSLHALTMMSSLLDPMNNMQWGINPMDEMAMVPNNMPINPSSTSMPMVTSMEKTQTTNSAVNPYAYMGISGDCQEDVMVGTVKEVVYLTLCVLYPPEPSYPIVTRDRPLGCKTVLVGNLPEKITEEIIREVFERCGEILKIQMNPDSFCHVRFTSEEYVDNALYFSGYRIKIKNKDDPPYTARLHVVYADSSDDAYDYKCKQRDMQRKARHRQRQEVENLKVPTPPPVLHYSEHEATELGAKLRDDKKFQQAAIILITWLERGECNKRNAGSFYSMIQSISSHVRRLMSEKQKYQDELDKARSMVKKQMEGILLQLNEIGKVFNTALLQKVGDHFTKSQRKNIELWKKQTEEIKKLHVEEVLNDRVEDEMDVSDGEEEKEESATKKTSDTAEEDVNKLKKENDVLRCQLEAAENEMMVLRSDSAQALECKDHDIQDLKQVLETSSKTLNQKRAADETELKKELHTDKDGNNDCSFNTTSSAMIISETDAHRLGLISTFLHVHPFGTNIDYICTYLRHIDSTIQQRDVETLMNRFPTIYREESTGIGASLKKKWKFLGFQS